MADDTKKNGHVDGCLCMGCRSGMMPGGMGYGRGGRGTFFLLRTLLTVLILIIVFWFGVQVGRLSDGYGFGRDRGVMMMRGGYGYPVGYNPGSPMMSAGSATSSGGLPIQVQ
jgi:hypothetical protein